MRPARVLLVVGLLLFAPVLVWAGPGGGLAGTDHDFAGVDGLTPSMGTNTMAVGLCTFCHTPHKANSTLLLWNHTLSANATFTWDVPNTTNGTPYATIANSWNGSTAKCLSCHDGSVAIGDVYWFREQPNSGGSALNTWMMGSDPSHEIGTNGSMAGNHPVAMPYPYQGLPNTYNSVTTSSAALPGYGIVASEWQATPLSPIRVFNDDGAGHVTAGAVSGKTGIECSSCHDPHNKASVDDYFLRGMLTGNDTNYICLKCHVK